MMNALVLLAFTTGLASAAAASDLATRTLLLDAAFAGKAIVAVGERGTILHSTDNAHTWTESRSHTTATLTGVSFADPSKGWAVGHDALILATHDGGATWTKQWQGENLTDSFLDVLALDANHVIAIGAYDLFLTTLDGGRSWTRRKILQEDYHLNRISRGPTGTLYIAGEHGTVLRSHDGGASWTSIPTPYDGSFYGVLPLGPTTLLVYGLRGRVFRSDDDGGDWRPVSTNESALLATAVRLKDGLVLLGGQARALLVSSDARQSFVRREIGVATGIAELLELPDGNVLATGEAGASVIAAAQLKPAGAQEDARAHGANPP